LQVAAGRSCHFSILDNSGAGGVAAPVVAEMLPDTKLLKVYDPQILLDIGSWMNLNHQAVTPQQLAASINYDRGLSWLGAVRPYLDFEVTIGGKRLVRILKDRIVVPSKKTIARCAPRFFEQLESLDNQ
jgi:hypothetical protein